MPWSRFKTTLQCLDEPKTSALTTELSLLPFNNMFSLDQNMLEGATSMS